MRFLPQERAVLGPNEMLRTTVSSTKSRARRTSADSICKHLVNNSEWRFEVLLDRVAPIDRNLAMQNFQWHRGARGEPLPAAIAASSNYLASYGVGPRVAVRAVALVTSDARLAEEYRSRNARPAAVMVTAAYRQAGGG
jgi:hypothetical protein